MKIVRNYQGKTTMSGGEFDVETTVKRYPIVEKKAKEMLSSAIMGLFFPEF